MKIIIIGNGVAGIAAARKIRELNGSAEIKIISAEPYHYYARPRLEEIILGKSELKDITIYNEDWYRKNQIEVILDQKISGLDDLKFDKLLLAVGSHPFLPPSVIEKNPYLLRTYDDALKIKSDIGNKNNIVILGGGVLGIELAINLNKLDKKVTVIETAEKLLPKQLSDDQAEKLQSILAKRGITVLLGSSLADADACEMLVVSIGVRANVDLAKVIGVKIDKGILVNEYLQTNIENIYAAGDCIQLGDKLWGFVKSSMEQGVTAAENMLFGNKKKCLDTKIDLIKIEDIKIAEL